MKSNRLIKISLIHILLPLIIGGFIYISFRSLSLRMFSWLDLIDAKQYILDVRSFCKPLKKHLQPCIFFSIPDGLWVYSFSSALLIFWNNDFAKVKYWLLVPFVSGILIEVLQVFKIFPGTFDFLDLLFSSLGLLLSKTFLNNKFNQYDK